MDEKDTRYRKQGIIGTLLFHLILFAILFFTVMKTEPQIEEGLLVNFGDTNTGSGSVEPAASQPQPTPVQAASQPVAAATPAAATPTPSDGETKDTQDFEEAAALREAKKKADAEAAAQRKAEADAEAQRKAEAAAEAQRKAQAEAEAKRVAEAEAKRKAEAEAEAKRIADEQARQAAAARSNVMKGFAGAGTGSNASQGTAGGSGNQGSLTGGATGAASGVQSGSGNSFSLAGRSLVGTLPKPSYNVQEEGVVVVEISVDKYGTVSSAAVQMKGTTIQNRNLWSVAVTAAKKAKFNSNPSAAAIQKGTITYRFHLE